MVIHLCWNLYASTAVDRRQKFIELCLCLGQVPSQSEIPGLEKKLSGLAIQHLLSLSHDTLSLERLTQDWMSACRFIGTDLEELDDAETGESLIVYFGMWSEEYDRGGLLRLFTNLHALGAAADFALEAAGAIFNSLTNIIPDGNERGTRSNVGIAAYWLALGLNEARESGALHVSAGNGHEFAYRGSFVDQDLWASLEFLDTVIANGIDVHPDSIFDTYEGRALHDWFRYNDLKGMEGYTGGARLRIGLGH